MFTEEEKSKLLSFLGYGHVEAPIWFLGMEEGFAKDSGLDIEENLRTRLQFDEVMDMQAAHSLMQSKYWKPSNRRFSSVWKWAAKFTRALLTSDVQLDDLDKANEYVRHYLGRDKKNGGKTFLAELMPLPRNKNSSWPRAYEQLFPDYEAYKQAVLPGREKRLGKLIATCHPRYLFCYGERYYENYKDLVGHEGWDKELVGEKVWIKNTNRTQVVLAPFFGMSHMSTKLAEQIIGHLKRA